MTVIVTTTEEIAEIVRRALAAELDARSAPKPAAAGEPSPDDMLTTEEAAAKLRVGRRTVTELANDGKLPFSKVGRLFRFRRGDLDDYLSTKR